MTVSIVYAYSLVGFGSWLKFKVAMVKIFAVYVQQQGHCISKISKLV